MNWDLVIIASCIGFVVIVFATVLISSEQRLRCMDVNKERTAAEVAMLCKT